jgi:tRNA A-37 threonylcarbamoyl transferase component Bud32
MINDADNLFQDYLDKNADREPINFAPLLKQRLDLQDSLNKKIKAYQKVMGLLHIDAPETKDVSHIDKIIGGCRIIKMIGQGGMGVVYLAHQEKLNREVVIKILRPFAAENKALKERFLRESRIIGRLNHKNIIPVYDIGEEEGSFYIIMKHVQGMPLSKMIEEISKQDRAKLKTDDIADLIRKSVETEPYKKIFIDGKTTTDFFCSLIIKVAEAVQYAHDNGVIHRDIKPSNIIVEPDGNPILLDFGLSHDDVETNLTVSGEFFGTPIYSAPETFFKNQASDNKLLDVYSLGVTLYEALTGSVPYEGQSIYEVYANVKNKEPISPKKKWFNIPSDLETILLTAIAKDCGVRYQSIVRFKNDLLNFLNYLPIEAKKPSYVYKTKIWLKRRSKLLTFSCLLLLFAFTGFYFFSKQLGNKTAELNARTLELNREKTNAEATLALEALRSNDYQTAYSKLKKIYESNPNNMMAAVWYFGLKVKIDQDMKGFKKSIYELEEKHPNDLYVKLAKIAVYYDEKDYIHEKEEEEYIFKNLNDETMWKGIPVYLNSLGAAEPLVMDFLNFALTKYPEDADLNFLMSEFCEKNLHDSGCHKEYLRKAAMSSTRYLTLLSDFYSKLPAEPFALNNMIAELENISSKDATAITSDFYVNMSLLYYREQNCGEAINQINQALNLDPRNAKYIAQKNDLSKKCSDNSNNNDGEAPRSNESIH